MNLKKITSRLGLLTIVLLMIQSCMPFKTGYHDLNLHYNKFFIAREKLKEVENDITKQHKDDYNKPLMVYPDCDSIKGKSFKSQLEECMKKASLGIDWHGGVYWTRDSWQGYSKWADDAYILIGKARIYANDFKNAKETFKYVNTKGKDNNAKHTALIWLTQAFIRNKEMYNAKEVLDFLAKEKLNKSNEREYYLTKAYFHQLMGEYPQTAKYVQKAIPLTPFYVKREKKARLHFIAAQIYQLYDRDSSAYINYRKCIKNNPPYELGFNAKLYSSQVTAIKNTNDVKRANKYFKKLLKDQKNAEYKDKIYYEMGKFELKQNNIDKGIEFLKLSTKATSTNPTQKGYTYLKLAETYYDIRKDYKTSKYYYDSTLISLPKDHPEYRKIEKRKKILDEFVQHYEVMILEDSLQKLAKMDTNLLSKLLDNVIEIDYQRQKREFLAKKKAEKRGTTNTNVANNTPSLLNPVVSSGGGNDKFYFYNPEAIVAGKADFFKKWGARELEDDWRRSVKEKPDNQETPKSDIKSPTATDTSKASIAKDKKQEEAKDKDGFVGVRLNKAALKAQIPFEKEKLDKSTEKLITAIFKIGKIYHFKLEEIDNAVEYYTKKHIYRFTESPYEPEVLYLLYLLYKDKNDDKNRDYYKSKLVNAHPNSEYAKLLTNPLWRKEQKEENKRIQLLYKEAFSLYEQKQYHLADSSVDVIINQYPKNDYEDKMVLLKVMIKGRTMPKEVYKESLLAFVDNYEKSKLVPYAKEMLGAVEKSIKADTPEKPKEPDNQTSPEQQMEIKQEQPKDVGKTIAPDPNLKENGMPSDPFDENGQPK